MGKRGPEPKGEYPGKSKVLSTRIRPDLRAQLDAASKESGRSLSQEIEHRLRRTFIDDDKVADLFGSKTNFFIMRAIDLAIQFNLINDKDKDKWLQDAEMFDRVFNTINITLKAIRPPVSTSKENKEQKKSDPGRESLPEFIAALIWKGIQDADPTLPLEKRSNLGHRLALLKSELGEIATRPKLAYDFAGDLRWRDEKFEREKEEHYVWLFRRIIGRNFSPEIKEGIELLIEINKQAWALAVKAGPLPLKTKESARKRARRKKK